MYLLTATRALDRARPGVQIDLPSRLRTVCITPSPSTLGEGWGESDFEHSCGTAALGCGSGITAGAAVPQEITLTPALSRSTGRGVVRSDGGAPAACVALAERGVTKLDSPAGLSETPAVTQRL